jgi:predicted dehydrogenase
VKRIALIGIGKMGMSHLAIANMTPGVEVAAICDVSKPLMYFLGKNTSFKTYSNYKKMLKEIEPDGVLICVPNAMHFDITKECIEKNINVFVEKPFTLSHRDSNELVELAGRYQVKGQVGYVNRFNPVFRRVKSLLEYGVIGDIVNYHNKMIGSVIVKENSKGWRNDYRKGGGCLFDYGPHCFDLSTYFFGYNVKVECASLKRIYSTRVDDMVHAVFVHDNNVVGLNYINWSDSSVRKASNTIEIIGTKGKITANKQEINIFVVEENPELNLQEGWNQLYVTDERTDSKYYLRGEDFSLQLKEFSDLINDKIERSVSSLDNARVTDLLLENVFKLAEEGN